MRPIAKFRKTGKLPAFGTPVKIKKYIADKEACGSFLVQQRYLDARRPNEVGGYSGYVPGAGGDVWWIEHKDGTIGAYMYNEITDTIFYGEGQ
jgi:hypothetical protein